MKKQENNHDVESTLAHPLWGSVIVGGCTLVLAFMLHDSPDVAMALAGEGAAAGFLAVAGINSILRRPARR
ncbi:MAG TPA: hypothetical protein VN711_04270 [Candidatus Saccharimonadales bacterium]|nr:hypothetical protein [Candidatus Saccharimonadales bacterium]